MLSLSENALKVLQSRYLLKTGNHGTETPEQLFERVSAAIAKAELTWNDVATALKWQNEFYELMHHLLFLPNSPTLMNAGTTKHQLSACFVLPVADNMDSIFTTLKHAALIQQSGGGTGFNFSHLRPKGDRVSSGNGAASGPVSFIKIFNEATEHIKQGGKRRGANMGILNITHPDIEAFINAKTEEDSLNNFNLSVGVTDDFMQAVIADREWYLLHPATGTIEKTVDAKSLWNKIVAAAWQTGDPGLIFLDSINHDNPIPLLGKIEGTNPCGEVPLFPYEACNLGSLNLSRFVLNEKEHFMIDWKKIAKTVNTAIRFLDDVIEVNNYLIPEIEHITKGNRKIGLGVMGWAELLILLNIPYASNTAVQLAAQLMQFIQSKAVEASVELAKERGVFPNWNKSHFYPHTPMRNATVSSIAPTGTISIIANTSPSIEPLFAIALNRQHVLNDETLMAVNPLFIDYLEKNQLPVAKILQQVKKEGHAEKVNELPPGAKKLFQTATCIAPDWHLRHQLAFQQFTDNAVSKTINLPAAATHKDVDEIYRHAWEHKAKGITIYRAQSKQRQIMTGGFSTEEKTCKVCPP